MRIFLDRIVLSQGRQTYRSQKCRFSSTAGSEQKNGGKLFRSNFAVEVVVKDDGRDDADQEGDNDC